MTKTELLNWLKKESQQWELLLDQVGLQRMEQRGVSGDWSMKDIVSHLAGWNRWLVNRMRAARQNEPEPPPPWPAHLQSDDAINAWIYESNRGRSLHEVLDEMRQVHQQLITIIEESPEDVRIELVEPAFLLVWLNDRRFEASEFFSHFHDDHEPHVRAWLARVERQ